jgi:hypothetical protein
MGIDRCGEVAKNDGNENREAVRGYPCVDPPLHEKVSEGGS